MEKKEHVHRLTSKITLGIFLIELLWIGITLVNRISGWNWKIIVKDFQLAFADNPGYLTRRMLPVVLFVCLYGLILRWTIDGKWNFRWNIRMGKKTWTLQFRQMVMGCKRWVFIGCTLISIGMLVAIGGKRIQMHHEQQKGWQGDLTVAHAGGEIDDLRYLNCKEGIETNYQKGFRTFEIDFAVTSDNHLVCKHDWEYVIQEGNEYGEVWDEATFRSVPIMGKYTPMSLGDLLELMQAYPDIYILTDTKGTEPEDVRNEFEIMVRTAREKGMESLLDRFIIQVYNEEMYDVIYGIYPFKAWDYTLYMFFGGDAETFLQCVRYCYQHDIQNISTWNYFANEELIEIADRYGIHVYVHTENEADNAKELYEMGVAGFYTDIVTNDMIKEK